MPSTGSAWAVVSVSGLTAATPRADRRRVRAVVEVIRPAIADAVAPATPGSCSRIVASIARTSQPYATQATVPTARTAIESRSWLLAAPIEPVVAQRRPRPTPASVISVNTPFTPRIIASLVIYEFA